MARSLWPSLHWPRSSGFDAGMLGALAPDRQEIRCLRYQLIGASRVTCSSLSRVLKEAGLARSRLLLDRAPICATLAPAYPRLWQLSPIDGRQNSNELNLAATFAIAGEVPRGRVPVGSGLTGTRSPPSSHLLSADFQLPMRGIEVSLIGLLSHILSVLSSLPSPLHRSAATR